MTLGRCHRCLHWTRHLRRVRMLDGRQMVLCLSCLDKRKAMGVRVEGIR